MDDVRSKKILDEELVTKHNHLTTMKPEYDPDKIFYFLKIPFDFSTKNFSFLFLFFLLLFPLAEIYLLGRMITILIRATGYRVTFD